MHGTVLPGSKPTVWPSCLSHPRAALDWLGCSTESYNRLSAQLDAQVAQIGKQNQLSVGGVGDPFSPLLAARSEAVTAARNSSDQSRASEIESSGVGDKHNRYSGAENNDESAKVIDLPPRVPAIAFECSQHCLVAALIPVYCSSICKCT